MQRLAWIVASFTIVAGTAWAQNLPTPDVPLEKPVLRKPQLLDGVELKVHKVVDGRVLAGQSFPSATLDALVGRGFSRATQVSGVHAETIYDGRLYRSYGVGDGLNARDFERYVGQTVKVRISEAIPGRSYVLLKILP